MELRLGAGHVAQIATVAVALDDESARVSTEPPAVPLVPVASHRTRSEPMHEYFSLRSHDGYPLTSRHS